MSAKRSHTTITIRGDLFVAVIAVPIFQLQQIRSKSRSNYVAQELRSSMEGEFLRERARVRQHLS
jgi:hypothetical protein